jgi:hypothetical protein
MPPRPISTLTLGRTLGQSWRSDQEFTGAKAPRRSSRKGTRSLGSDGSLFGMKHPMRFRGMRRLGPWRGILNTE